MSSPITAFPIPVKKITELDGNALESTAQFPFVASGVTCVGGAKTIFSQALSFVEGSETASADATITLTANGNFYQRVNANGTPTQLVEIARDANNATGSMLIENSGNVAFDVQYETSTTPTTATILVPPGSSMLFLYANGRHTPMSFDRSSTYSPYVQSIFQSVGTEAVPIPVGTTAQRPVTGINGSIRYNSTISLYEGYDGAAWNPVGFAFTGGTLTSLLTTSSAGISFGSSVLLQSSSNVLAIRNGTNAQSLLVNGSFTDASNFRRAFLRATNNTGSFALGVEGAGTGASGNTLSISTPATFSGSGNVAFGASNNLLFASGGRGISFSAGGDTFNAGHAILGTASGLVEIVGGVLVTHSNTNPALNLRAFSSTGSPTATYITARFNAVPNGTAGVGFGNQLNVIANSSTTASQGQGNINWIWADATHASRKARVVHTVFDTAERETLRMEASGTAAMIGFLGANAVIRQTLGAAATDAATTQTLANNIRTALINLGLGQT